MGVGLTEPQYDTACGHTYMTLPTTVLVIPVDAAFVLTVHVLTSNVSGFIYFKWHNPTQCNPSQSKSCHIRIYIISDWLCFAGTLD